MALILLLGAGPSSAQSPEAIGRIEGDSFTARGNVSVTTREGVSVTMLLSGSEVTVASGHARLTLSDGGEIDFCGPAQLSLLKAGGAITVALSYGRVHARVAADLPLQIFTAMVVASPVSVGGLPRDAVIGLGAAGEMCVYAAHGAVRIEHQFSGQRVLVPQLGEVSIPGGQIENLRESAGACRCEIPVAEREPPDAPRLTEAALRPQIEEKREEAKQEATPVFTAVMPPLTFSAESPAPPPLLRPQMIKLLREVRLRPVVYSGRVERSRPVSPQKEQTTSIVSGEAKPGKKESSFGAKLKNFFRRLFGRQTSN